MAHVQQENPDWIFETSWEVCNKVGGIYTVLSTRARTMQTLFPDQIIFIGPDMEGKQGNADFIESKILLKAWKKYALEKDDLKIRIGRWKVPGNPVSILVDFQSYYNIKDKIYFRMWEKYGINSLLGYGDYDEACMFAYGAALVMESLYRFMKLDKQKVVAHLNEWMLGMAALYLRDAVPEIATIFTTHATSIGRSICGNNKPLYGQLLRYNGDQMAQELNMAAKHKLEKQAAQWVDCFTTVSEITGQECEQLLDKKPDVITPNGFEPHFIPKGKAFATKREIARQALFRVTEQLTGGFIPEDAFLIATSGRYEYRNKGIDVFIEAVHRVKQAQPARAIVAFVLVPAQTKELKKDVPYPYITHELYEFQTDQVCSYLRYLNFTNQEEASVKIVFVPSYLNGNDGVFNLSYYDLLIGLDLTIFPSYYEPWGYTPLESIAFHIPSLTTSFAGFGLWAKQTGKGEEGVVVVERTDDRYFETAEEIKNIILRYAEYDSMQMKEARKKAYALSKKADWAHFIKYYLKAYDIALRHARERK